MNARSFARPLLAVSHALLLAASGATVAASHFPEGIIPNRLESEQFRPENLFVDFLAIAIWFVLPGIIVTILAGLGSLRILRSVDPPAFRDEGSAFIWTSIIPFLLLCLCGMLAPEHGFWIVFLGSGCGVGIATSAVLVIGVSARGDAHVLVRRQRRRERAIAVANGARPGELSVAESANGTLTVVASDGCVSLARTPKPLRVR